MPKYRLTADHYINDQLIPAGTVIGDDTAFPFNGEPSLQMEGVDEASRALIDKRFAAITSPGGIDDIPVAPGVQPGPRLEMVGEPQEAPRGGNPLIPNNLNRPEQPIQPYAIEQTSGSAVTRPDFSKSPEARQQDHDSIASTQTRGALYSGPVVTDTPPTSENTETDPEVNPDTGVLAKQAPASAPPVGAVPTISDLPAASNTKPTDSKAPSPALKPSDKK